MRLLRLQRAVIDPVRTTERETSLVGTSTPQARGMEGTRGTRDMHPGTTSRQADPHREQRTTTETERAAAAVATPETIIAVAVGTKTSAGGAAATEEEAPRRPEEQIGDMMRATALEDSTIIGTTIELASVRPTDLTIVIPVAVEILEISAGLLAGDTRIGANYCF